MAHHPEKTSHFYVGTDSGHILHLVRQESSTGPKAFHPDLGEKMDLCAACTEVVCTCKKLHTELFCLEAVSDVVSLQFSPFEPSLLLVGKTSIVLLVGLMLQ